MYAVLSDQLVATAVRRLHFISCGQLDGEESQRVNYELRF